MSPNLDTNPAAQPAEAGAQIAGLDLLLDLELPLTVRFGLTTMTLEQVLRLDTGSVVEFERALDEPVDLLVNNRLVARGEAVTVQGQYAIRILSIATRRDRLDSGSRLAAEQ